MKRSKLIMHFHTGKAIALLLVLFFAVALVVAGCGYKMDEMDERLAGKWVCVRASISGATMPVAEVFPKGLSIEFISNSKANVVADGEESIFTWFVEGDHVTLYDGDYEWKGTIDGDFLEFYNISYVWTDLLFGREGTDAMDPIHSISDAEKALVGTWVSESVVDLQGADIQVAGVAISDLLKLTFQPGRVINVIHKGEDAGDASWRLVDWKLIDDQSGNLHTESGLNMFYNTNEDGKLSERVHDGTEFLYTVTCVKE